MQRSILITGCSSGIGLAAALYLQQRHYRVFAACRKAEDVELMNTKKLEGVQLDLDDSNSIQAAADYVLQQTDGQLYALFNNAGFGVYGNLTSVSRHQLEQQFSTNFFGVHELTQCLLPAMLKQQQGRIIQTSSILGLVSTPNRGAYAASKYALEAWSDALRMELYKTNVRVSLIEPGPLTTHFVNNLRQAESLHHVSNPKIAELFTLNADAVLPKLHHALESRRPKIRYRVTLLAHTLALLKRLLPDCCMDSLLRMK